MVLVFFMIMMVQSMMELGAKIGNVGKVNNYFKMAPFMMVNGRTIRFMEEAFLFLLIEIDMKVHLPMD